MNKQSIAGNSKIIEKDKTNDRPKNSRRDASIEVNRCLPYVTRNQDADVQAKWRRPSGATDTDRSHRALAQNGSGAMRRMILIDVCKLLLIAAVCYAVLIL